MRDGNPAEARMAAKVSAVTITWNSADEISGCIDSLVADGIDPGEITVVDNASTDGTPELVAGRWPGVRLIQNAENVGFAAAANQGIA
ncbi:MAG TPA: glycosyltransferase, partial [Nitrospirota bacterium]